MPCQRKEKKKASMMQKVSSMGAAGGLRKVFMMTALRLSVSPRASSSGPGLGWGSDRPECGSAAGSPELPAACSGNTHTHTHTQASSHEYPNTIKHYSYSRYILYHTNQTSHKHKGRSLDLWPGEICTRINTYDEAQKDTKFIFDYGDVNIPVCALLVRKSLCGC